MLEKSIQFKKKRVKHKNVNVLDASELNYILKMVKMVNFMFVYILAQFNIHTYINT